jgi:probable HAF family extracellular repeat protein
MNIGVRRGIATVAFAAVLLGLTSCTGKTGVVPSAPSLSPTGGGIPRTALSAGTSFTFTRFDVPGALATEALGINDSGEIVGDYVDNSDNSHGFLDVGGVFTTIDFPGIPPGNFTKAFGINDSGVIVGTYSTGSGLAGFLDIGGAFTRIDFPDALSTEAFGINNNGDIVGDYILRGCGFVDCHGRSDFTHGFLAVGGEFSTFDHPLAFETQPFGINVNMEVVGNWRPTCPCALGFLAVGHNFTPVNVPGALLTTPYGINDNGEIVGGFEDGSGKNHGFLDVGNAFTQIDVPSSNPFTQFTVARGINNNGAIVGITINQQTGNSEGFLATPIK